MSAPGPILVSTADLFCSGCFQVIHVAPNPIFPGSVLVSSCQVPYCRYFVQQNPGETWASGAALPCQVGDEYPVDSPLDAALLDAPPFQVADEYPVDPPFDGALLGAPLLDADILDASMPDAPAAYDQGYPVGVAGHPMALDPSLGFDFDFDFNATLPVPVLPTQDNSQGAAVDAIVCAPDSAPDSAPAPEAPPHNGKHTAWSLYRADKDREFVAAGAGDQAARIETLWRFESDAVRNKYGLQVRRANKKSRAEAQGRDAVASLGIKRPANAWLFYRADKARALAGSGVERAETARTIARLWREESVAVRAEYEERAREGRRKYMVASAKALQEILDRRPARTNA